MEKAMTKIEQVFGKGVNPVVAGDCFAERNENAPICYTCGEGVIDCECSRFGSRYVDWVLKRNSEAMQINLLRRMFNV